MKIYGNVTREYCPVCLSKQISNVWKIPMTTLKKKIVINGANLNKFPLLNSELIYHFSKCKKCESVFLNPYSSAYWDDRGETHHVVKAKERKEWTSYIGKVDILTPFIKSFGTVVDLACGGGQLLTIMKESGQQWKKMIAVDINKACMDYISTLGYIEGIRKDVCSSQLELEIPIGSVDCVLFSEAFEHVQLQHSVIKQISKMMKVGAIVYLTAQALEADLPVRPEESVYITWEGLMLLLNKFDLIVIKSTLAAGRWKVIASKK